MEVRAIHADYIPENFRTTKAELNKFFEEDCVKNFIQRLNWTYLLYEDSQLIGYASVLNDKISWRRSKDSVGIIDEIQRKTDSSYQSFPAVKIGRFAIAESHIRRGYGELFIDWLFLHLLKNQNCGFRFMTVDAKASAISWYEKRGFVPLVNKIVERTEENDDTLPMYIDLAKWTHPVSEFDEEIIEEEKSPE